MQSQLARGWQDSDPRSGAVNAAAQHAIRLGSSEKLQAHAQQHTSRFAQTFDLSCRSDWRQRHRWAAQPKSWRHVVAGVCQRFFFLRLVRSWRSA